MSERDFAPMREVAIEYLALEAGDRVLEVGCGPGVNLDVLSKAVGDTGTITALDYSPAMVEAAQTRIQNRSLTNVTVKRADATTAELGGPYDGVLASLSLSVMPDVARAVDNIAASLAPDGRVVVFDIRPIPSGPGRALNPLLWRFLRWYANWNPDGNVLEVLEETFERCEVRETYFAGTCYTTVAGPAIALD